MAFKNKKIYMIILKHRTAVDIPKDTISKAVKFKQHVKYYIQEYLTKSQNISVCSTF